MKQTYLLILILLYSCGSKRTSLHSSTSSDAAQSRHERIVSDSLMQQSVMTQLTRADASYHYHIAIEPQGSISVGPGGSFHGEARQVRIYGTTQQRELRYDSLFHSQQTGRSDSSVSDSTHTKQHRHHVQDTVRKGIAIPVWVWLGAVVIIVIVVFCFARLR